MTAGSLITNNGKNILLYRTYTPNASLSSTSYTAPIYFEVGVSNQTPAVTDTALSNPVPIYHGTVLFKADSVLTGSGGGDNSTNNTTTYKIGAGESDNTAQNLIANNSSATKTWSKAITTYGNKTKYVGFWLYIKDATALNKFKTGSTCLQIKLGSDSSNYYSKGWLVASLATGWNWLHSGTSTLENLTQTGTVTGDIDYFEIVITTNNTTDTFTTGDVIFDLLRQWSYSDLEKTYVTGYPSFDTTNKEVAIRCHLPSVYANGFEINGLGIMNADTSTLLFSEDTFTTQSKTNTDEFIFTTTDRIV